MDTFDGSADALQVSRLTPDGKISRNTGIEVLPFLVQAMSLTGPAACGALPINPIGGDPFWTGEKLPQHKPLPRGSRGVLPYRIVHLRPRRNAPRIQG
jgi:hypothetical protein